jgi:hypothetical protein
MPAIVHAGDAAEGGAELVRLEERGKVGGWWR